MAEVAKEHKHSKKRRHEDGTDERSEKKHKKSKTVLEEQEVETPLADDTPTVTAPDAIVPDESSPKKHKKKSKKKDRHKDRGHEQHENVDIVAETNEDSGVIVPIEPQPEQTKTKKDKSKKKKKARAEEENNVDPEDEASKSASSSRNALDEADVTEPTLPEKKKKKKKTENGSKNKNGENETEVDQHKDVSRPSSTLQNLEASNSEDILQAFQQLDLARLQGVLGDLDLQSFGLDITPDENNDHSQPTTTSATKGTGKASSKRPFVDSEPSKRNKRKPVVDLKNLVDPNAGESHSNLLATKWLSSKQLQNLAETEGLVFKKGKFSFTESHAAKTAVEHYRTRNGLTKDAMVKFIFAKHENEHKRFWTEVALAVPGRPLQAIYHHVKVTYNPLGNQGKWIPAEDAVLRRAVADLGTSWTKVSQQIGRTAQDCKDRWRNHLSLSNKQYGKWTQEELDELTNIVRGLTVEKGKDLDSEIYWGAVSLGMGGRRSREQCRDKWKELRLKMDNENIQRWSKHNTYVLLQRMAALPVNDESEIVWDDLIHGQLNLWTAHRLRHAWKRAEESVPGYENMAYKNVVTSLLERYKKYAEPKHATKNSNLKFPQAPEPKSAEVIEDSADEEGSENDN